MLSTKRDMKIDQNINVKYNVAFNFLSRHLNVIKIELMKRKIVNIILNINAGYICGIKGSKVI